MRIGRKVLQDLNLRYAAETRARRRVRKVCRFGDIRRQRDAGMRRTSAIAAAALPEPCLRYSVYEDETNSFLDESWRRKQDLRRGGKKCVGR